MRRRSLIVNVQAIAVLSLLIMASAGKGSAQSSGDPPHPDHAKMHKDTGFAALQMRGMLFMGVDQYTSTHKFDALPDGGRIELQRNEDDDEGTRTIRKHMREIAAMFGSGDFSTPASVHMKAVPGVKVLAERKSKIEYTVTDLPRGAELRIRTRDKQALQAIREFMAFQRQDHHAEGKH